LPRNIGAKRIRRRQTGTFADQNHRQLGAQQLAYLVADGDPPLFDENQRPDRVAAS
jgi:hypothetical protein